MDRGRVVVAIPSDPGRARELMLRGRRLARVLGTDWVAVRVVAGGAAVQAGGDLASLAAAYGGRFRVEGGDDVAAALVALSTGEEARFLVLGRSRRAPLLRRLRRGTTERIVGAPRAFDVVVAAEGDGL